MKLDLFSIPIFIDNIDCNKIFLQNNKFEKTWESETLSSHNFINNLDNESANYLLKTISNLFKGNINKPYKLILKSIWENKYIKEDFQEKHIHPGSQFSFVIYKKIDESKTIFYNPAHNSIISFFNNDLLQNTNFFETVFKPKCRQNQIVVFPSFLDHMVQKIEDSVTISGNIILEINKEEKYGNI